MSSHLSCYHLKLSIFNIPGIFYPFNLTINWLKTASRFSSLWSSYFVLNKVSTQIFASQNVFTCMLTFYIIWRTSHCFVTIKSQNTLVLISGSQSMSKNCHIKVIYQVKYSMTSCKDKHWWQQILNMFLVPRNKTKKENLKNPRKQKVSLPNFMIRRLKVIP